MALTADQITALNFHDYHQMILPYLNGGGVGLKLLWENSDPTQAMSEGTGVVLSSSDYDLLMTIPFRQTNTQYAEPVVISPKGKGFDLCKASVGSGGAESASRPCAYVDDTHLTFGRAQFAKGTTAASDNNNLLIPYRIYGIKVYNRDVPGKTTLLWSNPNPSSTFAAKNIEIQGLSSYDLVKIVSYLSNSGTFEKTICESEMPYGEGNNVITGTYTSNRYRVVTISGNDLQFAAGNSGGNTDNTASIPYRIYGIKL